MQDTFQQLHGYDIGKWAGLLSVGNSLGFAGELDTFILPDVLDFAQGYIDDYRSALSYSLTTYYQTLVDWSNNYLDSEFSAQVGYNLPVDPVREAGQT